MKKRKIINFSSRYYRTYFPPKESELYYIGGWSSAVAKKVTETTDEFLVEDWRFEKEVDREESRMVGKIRGRLFPAREYPAFGLWSDNLVKAVQKEAEEYDVLFHFHSQKYSLLGYWLGYRLRTLPLVMTNYGATPPMEAFRQTKKVKFLVNRLFERWAAKWFDYFYITGDFEKRHLSAYVDPSRISDNIGLGLDFETVKPVPKEEARRRLGIDPHKKVMIYVGKFYALKGAQHIIDTYLKLKDRYDLQLILLGGYEDDPFYQKAKDAGATIRFRHEEDVDVPLYLSAADVYLILVDPSSNFYKYGGIGIAPLEAMACHTPVISYSLVHFPSTEDAKLVGEIPESPEDVARCVEKILNDPSPYMHCRETARKHYDWPVVANKLIGVYNRLFDEYYS